MTLHLVRHGRPLPVPGQPASAWELDPAGFDDVWALRESGRLPARAAWFCSPEPKAVATAQLLTEGDVGILDDLREQVRDDAVWIEDFEGAVRRAFAEPDTSAHRGWEPISTCRDRVVPAVRRVLDVHAGEDVVLVGHGTAWILVVAALTGTEPDLDRWRALALPDVLVVP
ncbi:histidine phosphatase family protein [Nocardioides sp. KIGAM211]|uniref:Histidine phosphatase family protein n=1 Tax=Nocardioides luti TaxID=2761101 RepID=A0A7X0RGE0_9ACTN|nr:histidine phosphatase family protein [Nocardioides luti]